MFRYREVSLQANARYLEALAAVDDPTNAKRDLDRLTIPKKDAAGRRCPASIRLRATIASRSKPSRLASIAYAGSLAATSGHNLNRRLICAHAGRTPASKAPKLTAPFDASTLTA